MSSQPDWRAAAKRRAIVPAVLAVIGLVLVAVADGTVRIVGVVVLGIAVTVAISLVFLEVGLSEDRERERR